MTHHDDTTQPEPPTERPHDAQGDTYGGPITEEAQAARMDAEGTQHPGDLPDHPAKHAVNPAEHTIKPPAGGGGGGGSW